MKVSRVMSANAHIANPTDAIQAAARMMADHDIGFLPVGENDRLVGMITDRDIAVRAVAEGRSPTTTIREIMTTDVKYVFEDDDLDEVVANMAENKVRRMPVLNQDKRLVGVLSLTDAAHERSQYKGVGEALDQIAQPGGAHSQMTDGPMA
jgi:CBS domain-containing protein